MTIDLSKIDLAALVERDGVQLRGSPDRERHGACPKCGGTDRFHLRRYQDRDYFFCRKCHDRRGDAIEYLCWQHGMSAGDAIRALGVTGNHPTNLPKPKPQPTTQTGIVIPDSLDEPPPQAWQEAIREFVADCAANLPGAARGYLHGRGITDDMIARWQIGYNDTSQRVAGEWWVYRGITIPHIYGGHLWGVNVRRRADELGDGKGKYINVKGSRAQLFNGNSLTNAAHTVIVTGGEFDCMLTQHHAPDGVAVVTFGSESKGVTWEADYLMRGKCVLVAYDDDEAGDKGAARWASIGERVRAPNGKDITEFFQHGGDVGAWLHDVCGVTPVTPPVSAQAAILAYLAEHGTAPRKMLLALHSDAQSAFAALVDSVAIVKRLDGTYGVSG